MRLKSLRWLALWMLGISGAGAQTVAPEWQLFRFEGRDYVTLENVAAFYGLPKPPPLVPPVPLSSVVPPPPVATAGPIATPSPTPVLPTPSSPIQAREGQVVTLANDRYQLAFAIGSREASINGVKQWLSFPTHFQDGKLLISTLDLSKTVEPHLRPERIEGLKPFGTVVLDAGHGGADKGAASRFGFEKDFALDVVTRLRPLLERRGLKVVLTRSTDLFIPLHQRPAVANQISDSIFVSVHFNATSTNPDARGFEIYSVAPRGAPATNDAAFRPANMREEPANQVDTLSSALAGSIYHSMLGNVPMQDHGIKYARFAVLRLCRQPAVLIEGGFVSNSPESQLIGSPAWRQALAESIATGVEEYRSLAAEKHAPKVVAEYRKTPAAAPQ